MAGTATTMVLPKEFTPLADFMEQGKIKTTFVNVVGLVKDYRRPVPTSGKDYKCAFSLFDLSVQAEVTWDVVLNVFRPKMEMEQMPECRAGDVAVVYVAKVQNTHGILSLLTNYQTAIHIYPAVKIPKPPKPASLPFTPNAKDKDRKPLPQIEAYISWLYENVDKERIPEVEVFEARSEHSTNVKDKLRELKAVQNGDFCNLIVQTVKDPFDSGDKVSLYVSDYTENPHFYNHPYPLEGKCQEIGKDGDPYGYISGKKNEAKGATDWQGPYGRKTLQITCYEPHATVIRSEIKHGTWVQLLNVQIKWGSNGFNLEGFLREDRDGYGRKVPVNVLDPHEDPENMHPYLKNAIRRKRDNEKTTKAQQKQLNSAMENKGEKRSATDQLEKSLSRKQRRALQRERKAQRELEAKQSEDILGHPPPTDLNPLVACENHGRPTSSVSDILRPATYQTTVQGTPLSLKLPFTVAQYRANVRVINFHPPRLQDFAFGRKRTEYDVLSDNSHSDSDSDDEDAATLDSFVGDQIWEWRFALLLQDASSNPNAKKQDNNKNNTMWVVVDNMDAQLLIGLDACNLRADTAELSKLRERMFILWGDLEEKKSKQLAEMDESKKKQKAKASMKNVAECPPHSSDVEMGDKQSGKDVNNMVISNRPFTCCIRQYGVRVREPNEAKADAGDGKRWERVFGLFGTKVCGI